MEVGRLVREVEHVWVMEAWVLEIGGREGRVGIGHGCNGAGHGAGCSAGGNVGRVGEGGAGGLGRLVAWLSSGSWSWVLTRVERSCW